MKRLISLLIVTLLVISCTTVGVDAASTAIPAPSPKFIAYTSGNVPAAGYKLYTYETGTTTPKTSWTDNTKGSANTNPIILDAKGQCDLWIDGTDGAYRLRLLTDGDVTVWTVDGVVDFRPGTSDIIPDTDNAYDIGSAAYQWKDLYIDGKAYIDELEFDGEDITSSGEELNLLDLSTMKFQYGMYNRSDFSYYGGTTAYTVIAQPAWYMCKDKVAWWDSTLVTGAIGTPAADTWYYLYLDYSAITSGTEITTSELIWSDTAPMFYPTERQYLNGDDRCIFATMTNSGPTNTLNFHHSGTLVLFDEAIADRAGSDLDNSWPTSVTLTMPGFSTQALVRFEGNANGDTDLAVGSYRQGSSTATDGHAVYFLDEDTVEYANNTMPVITNSGQVIDIEHSVSGAHFMGVYTSGWYLPDGM